MDEHNDTEEVINEGVKETKTPGDGDILSALEFMKENNTVNIPELINDVINNGVNQTAQEPSQRTWKIGEVIKEGIKKTKAGGYLGFIKRSNTLGYSMCV